MARSCKYAIEGVGTFWYVEIYICLTLNRITSILPCLKVFAVDKINIKRGGERRLHTLKWAFVSDCFFSLRYFFALNTLGSKCPFYGRNGE